MILKNLPFVTGWAVRSSKTVLIQFEQDKVSFNSYITDNINRGSLKQDMSVHSHSPPLSPPDSREPA